MLQDWILFVSVVAPATRYAHRFSILVPVQLDDDLPTQAFRKETASRVAEQAKPAHTAFDVKLYWAMFQAGEARVGMETVLGPSSRFAALVLGSNYLGPSFFGFTEPWNVRGRRVAGRDQLARPTN
jgi:hypothetical protein